MAESCLTCRFWKEDTWAREGGKWVEPEYSGKPTAGWCRRFPPSNDLMPSEMPFPTTAPEQWCGEYSPGNGPDKAVSE